MLKRMLLPLAVFYLALAVSSCGHSFRYIQERNMTEAEYLRLEVIAKNLDGDEITIGNAFLTKARVTSAARQAADYADLAAAYFRTALARHSLAESVDILQEAETALFASKEQVEKYEQILASVKGE